MANLQEIATQICSEPRLKNLNSKITSTIEEEKTKRNKILITSNVIVHCEVVAVITPCRK